MGRGSRFGNGVGRKGKIEEGIDAYSTYDIIVIGEMCLAVLAAEDLGRVEVDVVCKAHLWSASTRPSGRISVLIARQFW